MLCCSFVVVIYFSPIFNPFLMKNLQKFLCLLALAISFNSLSAQNNSLILVDKGLIGENRFKFDFADEENHLLCDAKLSWFSFLDTEYVPMKVQSCKHLGDGKYKFQLLDPTNTAYQATYAPSTGLILTDENDMKYIFGKETVLKSGQNQFTILDAGEKSYVSLTIPKYKFADEVFTFTSEVERQKFSQDFALFLSNRIKEVEFSIKSMWEFSNYEGAIKLTKKEDPSSQDATIIVVQFRYNGEVSTFVTE